MYFATTFDVLRGQFFLTGTLQPTGGGSGNATVTVPSANAALTPQQFADLATLAVASGGAVNGPVMFIDKTSTSFVDTTSVYAAVAATSGLQASGFSFDGNTVIFGFDMSYVVSLNNTSFSFVGCTNLGDVVAAALTTMTGSSQLNFVGVPGFFSAPVLATIGAGSLLNPGITGASNANYTWAALTTLAGNLTLTNNNYGNLSFPALTTLGGGGTLDLSGVTVTGVLSFPALTAMDYPVFGTPSTIASLALDGLTSVIGFTLPGATSGISMNGLLTLDDNLDLTGDASLANLSMENLASIPSGKTLILDGNPITIVNLPSLTSCAGTLSLSSCGGLDEVLLPSLQSVSGTVYINASPVTTVNLSALASCAGSLYVYSTSIESLTLASLASCNGTLNASSNTLATEFHFPVLASLNGTISMTGGAMTTETIDTLFNELAATVTSGSGTINVAGQTPTAGPSAASAAAISFLTGLGITVSYDVV